MAAGIIAILSGLALGEGLSPQETLAKAVQEVSCLSFKTAYPLFDDVLKKAAEGSDLWQKAVFGKALCAQQTAPATPEAIQEAQGLYKALIEKAPDSPMTPRAMMNLGRIAELSDYYQDVVDLAGARQWYEKVRDRYADKPIAGEAVLRIAGTYIQTFKKDEVAQGIELLRRWLAAHPDDPLASGMWQYLGDTYFFPLEEYDKCLECYLKVDKLGLVEKGLEGPFYWRVAMVADRYVKDRDVAVGFYAKVIRLASSSGKGYEAQLAMKRLGAKESEIPPLGGILSGSGKGHTPVSTTRAAPTEAK